MNRVDSTYIKEKISILLSLKPMYSNYFGLNLDDVEYIEKANTLVVIKPYESFRRVYFISTDEDELIEILKILPNSDVINIPTKTEISGSLQNILSKSGYSLFEVYHRMYNNKIEQQGIKVESFALLEDIPAIYERLYSLFVPFSDWLPTKKDLENMVENKQIYIIRDENNAVVVATAFKIEKTSCYWSFLYSSVKGGAKKVTMHLFDYLSSLGIKRVYFWVREGNVAIDGFQKSLGSVYDGLKDYTFTKGLSNKYKQ
jgi:hypothetical protein